VDQQFAKEEKKGDAFFRRKRERKEKKKNLHSNFRGKRGRESRTVKKKGDLFQRGRRGRKCSLSTRLAKGGGKPHCLGLRGKKRKNFTYLFYPQGVRKKRRKGEV